MSSPRIYIVMATYNGAQWLDEQLASIQSQSYDNWVLMVSDDGSEDETLAILEQVVVQDERVQLLPSRNGTAGHVSNFEYLLTEATACEAEYVFLADQDDVWEPQKLQTLLRLAQIQGEQPLLVFSDMELIDSNGKLLGSYMQTIGYNGKLEPAELLRQNFIAGCSVLVNKKLLALALPFPETLKNHDWWLGLCAAATGSLQYCPEKLVRYRQHCENTIGAGNMKVQLRNLCPIVKRQRQVFESKLLAVAMLVKRLEYQNLAVPVELKYYRQDFSATGGWARVLALLRSEYKPRSKALLLVQLMALLGPAEK